MFIALYQLENKFSEYADNIHVHYMLMCVNCINLSLIIFILFFRLNREESEEDHHMLSANDHDEKRMRRQIANSNERRRMQSINAGFQSLRQLLPHHEGEKLSKVSPVF